MSAPGNNGTGGPEDFRPPAMRDPHLLATTTVKAVDHISAQAAAGLRDAARELRAGADEMAKYLEGLAEDHEREGARASGAVADFVTRAVSVHQTALTLAQSLRGDVAAAAAAAKPPGDSVVAAVGRELKELPKPE